jgi:predicted nucleic acid-binding protein
MDDRRTHGHAAAQGLIFVDTNVLLDIVSDDAAWADWSTSQLEAADLGGGAVANAIVYAEFSLQYGSVTEVDRALAHLNVSIEPIPKEALFLAARANQIYRRAGGARPGVLSDFFVGAHAAVTGRSLLTRDAGRFRTYFPQLNVIAPN